MLKSAFEMLKGVIRMPKIKTYFHLNDYYIQTGGEYTNSRISGHSVYCNSLFSPFWTAFQ
jgi:hypothetical protein